MLEVSINDIDERNIDDLCRLCVTSDQARGPENNQLGGGGDRSPPDAGGAAKLYIHIQTVYLNISFYHSTSGGLAELGYCASLIGWA